MKSSQSWNHIMLKVRNAQAVSQTEGVEVSQFKSPPWKNKIHVHEKKNINKNIFKSLPWAENRLITALCSMFICSNTFFAISILSPEKKKINFMKKKHLFGRYYIFLALTRHLIGQSPIMKMQGICCQIKKMIFWKSKKKIGTISRVLFGLSF